MKIVGFNFKKLNIEKTSDKFESLKINTNIDITNVKQIKPEIFQSKEEIVEVEFDYFINYDPDIAKLSLSGTILVMAESKIIKDFIKQWKQKKLPEEHRILIFNVILKKSNLKAMQLEDELNLPLHIPLPSVKE
jgi:hypothetical protein|tara:strand:+ start:5810 stop:6211 length:402 start_codon:yes stop_codon:yes gene_type:complete